MRRDQQRDVGNLNNWLTNMALRKRRQLEAEGRIHRRPEDFERKFPLFRAAAMIGIAVAFAIVVFLQLG